MRVSHHVAVLNPEKRQREVRGVLGRVYNATNTLGEEYALKVLLLPGPDDPGSERDRAASAAALEAAFRLEYETQRSVAGLRGFPRPYGWGVVDGAPAIVMEWIEGMTLATARRELAVDDELRVSPLTAARLGVELFELVARLSLVGEGLAHRDLSPSNVMVRTARRSLEEQRAAGEFDLCLVDFGSSAQTGAGGTSFTESSAMVRHATADYAPPEMLCDDVAAVGARRRSAAVDVYAAASVLCELVGGRPPFWNAMREQGAGVGAGAGAARRVKLERLPERPVPAHRGAASLAAVLQREPEAAVAVAPLAMARGLSPESEELGRALCLADEQLVDVLMTCLAKGQERRPDAATMRDELRGFCERYADNVGRALADEPLTPCMTGAAWLAFAPLLSGRRLARVAGGVASAGLWVFSVGATAWLIGDVAAAGPLTGLGTVPGWAVGAALALPAAAALLARGRDVADRRGLTRGTAALLVVSAAVAVAAVALLELGDRLPGLLAAVFAGAAAAWCPMVLDYACAHVPALMREATRQLPEGPGPGLARR